MGFDYLADMIAAFAGKSAASHHVAADPLVYGGFNHVPAFDPTTLNANHADFLFGSSTGSDMASDLVKPSAFYAINDHGHHHVSTAFKSIDADPFALLAKIKSATVNSSFSLGPGNHMARVRFPDNLYHHHTDSTKIASSLVSMLPNGISITKH